MLPQRALFGRPLSCVPIAPHCVAADKTLASHTAWLNVPSGPLQQPDGPSAGALDAENPKSKHLKRTKYKKMGNETYAPGTDLHNILHARSCIHFLLFPYPPRPRRPLKRPQNFNLLITFFNCLFCAYLLRPIWAMVTRPVQGPKPVS